MNTNILQALEKYRPRALYTLLALGGLSVALLIFSISPVFDSPEFQIYQFVQPSVMILGVAGVVISIIAFASEIWTTKRNYALETVTLLLSAMLVISPGILFFIGFAMGGAG